MECPRPIPRRCHAFGLPFRGWDSGLRRSVKAAGRRQGVYMPRSKSVDFWCGSATFSCPE